MCICCSRDVRMIFVHDKIDTSCCLHLLFPIDLKKKIITTNADVVVFFFFFLPNQSPIASNSGLNLLNNKIGIGTFSYNTRKNQNRTEMGSFSYLSNIA